MQFLFLFNRILDLFIFVPLEFTNTELSMWLFYLVLFVIILFIYVFLAVLGLHCCAGFSLVVVRGFLIAADSVFVEYKL